MFRLDDVVASLDVENVLFLSVDVEGMDLDVLKGASRTLSVTQVVCVEADSEADEKKNWQPTFWPRISVSFLAQLAICCIRKLRHDQEASDRF